MTKRIVFKNKDGSCGIIIPAKNWEGKLKDLAKKDVPKGLKYRVVKTSKVPIDRTFRDAWTDDLKTDTIDVDMKKARKIHMKKLRKKRDEKLAVLDVETMRGNDVQSEKQILRDLPATIDLDVISNPDDLKDYLPEVLK